MMTGERAAGPPDATGKKLGGQANLPSENLMANGSLVSPARIKICGLSRSSDIDAVNRWRPDFAGFVFAKSKRQVTPEQARELILMLDPGIIPVGVFVDREPMELAEITHFCGLGAVQLHGREGNDQIRQLRGLLAPGVLIIKAIQVKSADSLTETSEIPADLLLLDAFVPGTAGGSGTSFPWSWVRDLTRPYLLAGGLDGENVQQAIALLQPWGVDVSSGVETAGDKDEIKIRNFVENVRGR